MSVNNLKAQVAVILPLSPSFVCLTTTLDPLVRVQFEKFLNSSKEMKIKIISVVSKCCCLGIQTQMSVSAR
jgi:hypothetical protein